MPCFWQSVRNIAPKATIITNIAPPLLISSRVRRNNPSPKNP